MTTDRKEIMNLITRIAQFLNRPVTLRLRRSTGGTELVGRRWCSFDCYDAGGCESCSDWFEWNDKDYGLVGEWRHKSCSDKIVH